MIRTTFTALALTALPFAPSLAQAQAIIGDELQAAMSQNPTALHQVIIFFNGRRTFTPSEIQNAGATRNERQTYVAQEIVAYAQEQDTDVWDALAAGGATRRRRFEVAYAVVADANASTITAVAALPNVRYINLRTLGTGGGLDNDPPSSGPGTTWGVEAVRAPAVWAQGFTGQGVVVAVFDAEGTAEVSHPDLTGLGRRWDVRRPNNTPFYYEGQALVNYGWDAVNADNVPEFGGHGVNSAGVVGGDGTNSGTTPLTPTGVAYGSTLMFVSANGTGATTGLTGESSTLNAFDFLVDVKASYGDEFHLPDLITMSLGYRPGDEPNHSTWRFVTDNLYWLELPLFTVAGNESNEPGQWPPRFNLRAPATSPPPWLHPDHDLPVSTGAPLHVSGVIAVGALSPGTTSNPAGIVRASSSTGPMVWDEATHGNTRPPIPAEFGDYPDEGSDPFAGGLTKPDLAAPAGVRTTNGSSGYVEYGGTSSATPHVAGIAALLLSANQDLTPAQIAEALFMTADDITADAITCRDFSQPPVEYDCEIAYGGLDNASGAGRPDAYAALKYVIEHWGATFPVTFTIPAGETWNVQNVTLRFAPGARLLVRGTLNAMGTTFRSTFDNPTNSQRWAGIVAAGTAGAVNLSGGSVVRHATAGVTVYDPAQTVIDGATITENTTGLLVQSNVGGTGTGAIVEGAVISDNGTGVRTDYVACYGTACTCLTGCEGRVSIDASLLEGNGGEGIYALNGRVEVRNSCVRWNAGHGLTAANALVFPFTDNSLSENGEEETPVYGAAVLSGGDLQLSPATAPGGNRLASNAELQLYVGTGAAAFAGYGSSSGENAFESPSGCGLVHNGSSATLLARHNWWGAAPPAACAFTGDVDEKFYLAEDPAADACNVFPGGSSLVAGGPPPDGVEGEEPGAGLQEIGAEIRRLRAALASGPAADSAAGLVRALYTLQRLDRADALGERAATMGALAALRGRLTGAALPTGLRAAAEAALEVEAADALARGRYAEGRALIAAFGDRVSGAGVRRALTLTRAFLEAQRGRRAEAASLVAGVAAEVEDARERRELAALAAALAEDPGAAGASLVPGVAPVAVNAAVAGEPALSVVPNPARGQATVTLSLPAPSAVRLVVYDVLGREVARLHDGPLPAGTHPLRLDGAALPAGVYVVRAAMEPEGAGRRTMTRRLTLLK